MRYLLDTNIISQAAYDPHGSVAGRIQRLHHLICTSIVVASELRFGVAKQASATLAQRIDALLDQLNVLPLSPPVDRIYGDVRANLERRGELIGANDLFIAAHALALGYALVTDNDREFSRVNGLAVENWLR